MAKSIQANMGMQIGDFYAPAAQFTKITYLSPAAFPERGPRVLAKA
jgi:hypothetical protein